MLYESNWERVHDTEAAVMAESLHLFREGAAIAWSNFPTAKRTWFGSMSGSLSQTVYDSFRRRPLPIRKEVILIERLHERNWRAVCLLIILWHLPYN